MMLQREFLEEIKQWFATGEADALIRAYRQYYETGTTGAHSHVDPKPAAVNAHGVLQPQFFESYMDALHQRVQRALTSNVDMRLAPNVDYTLPILTTTLEQMMASVAMPPDEYQGSGKTVGELFVRGKEIGRGLRNYFNEVEAQFSQPDESSRRTKSPFYFDR